MEKVSKESLDQIFSKAMKTQEEIHAAPANESGTKNTNAQCAIPGCCGSIIEEKTKRYFGDPGHAIIGPGYANQLTTIVALYCSQCGVMYHHLPGTNQD